MSTIFNDKNNDFKALHREIYVFDWTIQIIWQVILKI